MPSELQQALDGAELVRATGRLVAVWHGGYTLNFYRVVEGDWEPAAAKEWGEKPTRAEVDVAATNWLRGRDASYIPDDRMPYVCGECGHVGMEGLGNPEEPPDPDRHGNRRYPFKCPGCDQRGTLLTARHGGTEVSKGHFSRVE